MCLLLYIATDVPLAVGTTGKLTVEEVESEVLAELQSIFSKPGIRYVGVGGGCSCDFRHVMAEEPFDYYDGMFDHEDDDERRQAIAVMSELLGLVQDRMPRSVELLPAWDRERVSQSNGTCTVRLSEVRPERFFFIEDYLYTLLP
jgi:hypothetical protein